MSIFGIIIGNISIFSGLGILLWLFFKEHGNAQIAVITRNRDF